MDNRTLKRQISRLGSVAEAADLMGITRQAVYKWLRVGISRYGLFLLNDALAIKRAGKKRGTRDEAA